MAEQEILPCPAATDLCCAIKPWAKQDNDGSWRVACVCGVRGTEADKPEHAIRFWNELPREEPWIEVAKAGLPEPSEQLWDIFIVGVATVPIGESVLSKATRGEQFGETLWKWHRWKFYDKPSAFESFFKARVTHYRIHRAPKGPR